MSNTKEEIEFKWSVKSPEQFGDFREAAKAAGAKLGSPQSRHNHDLYLDTAKGALEKSKITCRLRDCNGRFEMTIKAASKLKGGLARRSEKNIPLEGVRKADAALALVRDLYHHPATNGDQLEVRFSISNNRRDLDLSLPGAFKAQVSFDEVAINAGLKTVGMREIEMEFLEGNLRKFLDFARQMTKKAGLLPARMSKVATARAAIKYLH
jgi:triphosphatase